MLFPTLNTMYCFDLSITQVSSVLDRQALVKQYLRYRCQGKVSVTKNTSIFAWMLPMLLRHKNTASKSVKLPSILRLQQYIVM